jgi:prephenate dehydrogenase
MPPIHFKNLLIYGVGLLGGSTGLAVKQAGLADRVTGLGRSADQLEKAKNLQAIDELSTDPGPALEQADALVLAIPPQEIRRAFSMIKPRLRAGTFVTDVGSVKHHLVAEAESVLPENIHFIGSHPMAGSEKSGVEHASVDFFRDTKCILTPTSRTHPEALETARNFWEALGATILILSPEDHDEIMAGISHFPHLLASALVQSICRGTGSMDEIRDLVGGGLRDTTRIAAAATETWKQIFVENRRFILRRLDSCEAVLREWRTALGSDDPGELDRELERLWLEGRNARLSLNKQDP